MTCPALSIVISLALGRERIAFLASEAQNNPLEPLTSRIGHLIALSRPSISSPRSPLMISATASQEKAHLRPPRSSEIMFERSHLLKVFFIPPGRREAKTYKKAISRLGFPSEERALAMATDVQQERRFKLGFITGEGNSIATRALTALGSWAAW